MSKAETKKPSHKLTTAEKIFMELVKNSKYKDEGSLRVNLIRFKSKYMLRNVAEMERLVE